jgi:phage tail-like protein
MIAASGSAAESPFGNMRFRVAIEGQTGVGAVEVILPEARIAPRPSRDGKADRTQLGALTLRRGVTRSHEWYDWWDAARRPRTRTSKPLARTVTVTLLDAAGVPARHWIFGGAVPLAYRVSPLNALGNETLLETLELKVVGFKAEPA